MTKKDWLQRTLAAKVEERYLDARLPFEEKINLVFALQVVSAPLRAAHPKGAPHGRTKRR